MDYPKPTNLPRVPRQGLSSNPMEVNATVTATLAVQDPTAWIGKASGGDFTTAYQAPTGITIGALPDSSALAASDILTVFQISAAGEVLNIYGRADATMSIAGGVLTIAGATFSGTDTFIIYTNLLAPATISTAGLATEVTLAALAATDFASETTLAALAGVDFATQTTLAAILADTATMDASLASLAAEDFATQTTLAAILADTATMDSNLASLAAEDFATETTLALLNGKDFATQTTLAALAAVDFATETTLALLNGKDFATQTTLAAIAGSVDGIEALLTAIDGHVDGLEAKDYSTETTLALVKTSVELIDNAIHSIDSVAGASDAGVTILAKRDDALSTLTPVEGDYVGVLVDSQGSLWVRNSVNQQSAYSTAHITTATTTNPKSGPGFFFGLVVNTAVGSGVITLYDNTSAAGTVIAILTYPATITGNPGLIQYSRNLTTGLTIVTDSAFDVTVMYN